MNQTVPLRPPPETPADTTTETTSRNDLQTIPPATDPSNDATQRPWFVCVATCPGEPLGDPVVVLQPGDTRLGREAESAERSRSIILSDPSVSCCVWDSGVRSSH